MSHAPLLATLYTISKAHTRVFSLDIILIDYQLCSNSHTLHEQSYLRQLCYLTSYSLTPMVILPNLGRSRCCKDCCSPWCVAVGPLEASQMLRINHSEIYHLVV